MSNERKLEDKLWDIAAPRMAENILSKSKAYKNTTQKDLKKWLNKGKVVHARKTTNYNCENQLAIILTGKVILENNQEVRDEQIIENEIITLSRNTKIYLLPKKIEQKKF